MNNAPPAASGRFRGVLEEIAREAAASQSNGDVAIVAREAGECLEKLGSAPDALRE